MAQKIISDPGRLSHAYIVSSPDREEARRTADHIAAAAVCSRGHDVPCGQCRDCRKAQAGIHPDIVTVSRLTDDKGRKKREIAVDQIRAIIADAHVLPNEAERKVYIIEDAETMNLSAQNAALKLLEEPPKGVILLLCAVNSQPLLPTVRSRCAEIKCGGETAAGDEESVKAALGFLRAVASRDRAKLFEFCVKNEAMDTRQTADFIDCASALAADMLCLRRDNPGMTARELTELCALLDRCRDYLRVNTGVKHIFGLLAVDAISGSGNRG